MCDRVIAEPRFRKLADELLEDFKRHQKFDSSSTYNKIKQQCKEAAKQGYMHISMQEVFPKELRDLLRDDGLKVDAAINEQACECDYQESCRYHPQELTVLTWGDFDTEKYIKDHKGGPFSRISRI